MQSEKNHDMGSCPDGTVVIAVSSSPVTTSVTAPATAISWYDLYNKHDLVFLLLVYTE